MAKDKLENLERLYKEVNKNYATFEDVGGLFKQLMDAWKSLKTDLTKKIDARLASLRDGRDGKDGKDGKRGERGYRGETGRGLDGEDGYTPIKGVDYFDGKDGKNGSPDTPQEILNKIHGLLEIEDIKGLKEQLKHLENSVVGRPIIGGVTNMRIIQAFKYILKTEAVQGTINGTNTTFTVSQTIFAILSLSINGEVIAQLPNYTIRGRTIEFSSAIPADYAGKDFECKYV